MRPSLQAEAPFQLVLSTMNVLREYGERPAGPRVPLRWTAKLVRRKGGLGGPSYYIRRRQEVEKLSGIWSEARAASAVTAR